MNADNSQKGKVIVIGGSHGGLLAANLLLKSGWDVEVYERVGEELSARGAGIVTHKELLDVLSEIGIAIDENIGVKVELRVTFGHSGDVVGQYKYPQILTGWSRLYQLLKASFPGDRYHIGKTLVAIEQKGEKVTAIFNDGDQVEADILIGADGVRSTVRQLYSPEVIPEYAGYVAWRGLVDEKELSPETHKELFEKFAFCLPSNEQMVGYPVAGAHDSTAPGNRRFNIVWYRPAEESTDLVDMLTDDKGNFHEMGIPPGLIRKDVVSNMRKAAETVLSPQFSEVVSKIEQPLFQPIYDVQCTKLVFGRVVLLGDSAFVARPHCGAGVTKAAGDAVTLRDALNGHPNISEALSQYEESRISFGASIVAHARHLGAYMQAQLKSEAEREMAEKYRTPEAVMHETAIMPNF